MRPCPLCNRDNQSMPVLGYSLAPWELKRCGGCGLVYLVNPPEYVALEEEFAWEKTWAEEGAKRRGRNPMLHDLGHGISTLPRRLLRRDKLGRWVRRFVAPGPVLDVGCGEGVALERLPEQYVPFGVEVSRKQAQVAQSRVAPRGGRVVQADALSGMKQFEAGFFTGVLMNSYLEHEVNPRAALESARGLMRPNARLIVKVPNFGSFNRVVRGARWCGFRHPDHVNYFVPELLGRLLRDSGFRVLRAGAAEHLPTSDNMWALAENS
jgi:SAM-dependent methyltransferase